MCSFLLPKLTREKNETKNREKLKHLKKKSKYNNIFFFLFGLFIYHTFTSLLLMYYEKLRYTHFETFWSIEKVSILYQRLQPLTHNFMRNEVCKNNYM